MTVRRLRLEMSSNEFETWRARDRALAKLSKHAENKVAVQTAVRGRGRRGMGMGR